MKKLMRWLQSKNYDFDSVNYGSHYFDNVSISKTVVMVKLDRETYRTCIRDIERIKKYVYRYGYDIITEGYNLFGSWVTIGTYEDVKSLKKIWKYEKLSVRECEIIMHNYHLNGIYKSHHANLEKELKKVMSKYESDYIKDSFQVLEKTA